MGWDGGWRDGGMETTQKRCGFGVGNKQTALWRVDDRDQHNASNSDQTNNKQTTDKSEIKRPTDTEGREYGETLRKSERRATSDEKRARGERQNRTAASD